GRDVGAHIYQRRADCGRGAQGASGGRRGVCSAGAGVCRVTAVLGAGEAGAVSAYQDCGAVHDRRAAGLLLDGGLRPWAGRRLACSGRRPAVHAGAGGGNSAAHQLAAADRPVLELDHLCGCV
ncbi:hypothetical protein H4R23_006126, partial [Coemansia sp. Cherry 401B]